jgi:ABC-type amino acid transport substrate-binding protein
MLELFHRRRVWVLTGAGLLTMALAAAWLLHRPYAGRTYRIGARTNGQYSIVAADGRVSGIAVDVVSEAARRAGIHLLWIPSPEGLDKAMGSKKVDLWPAVTILPGRRRGLHISDPWLSGDSFVISKGPKVSDWKGARVAYALAPASQVAECLPHAIPVEKPDEDSALRAVCTGEAAGAIVWMHSVGSPGYGHSRVAIQIGDRVHLRIRRRRQRAARPNRPHGRRRGLSRLLRELLGLFNRGDREHL